MHSTGTGQPVETQDVFFWRLAGRSAPTGLAIVHWIGCINAIKIWVQYITHWSCVKCGLTKRDCVLSSAQANTMAGINFFPFHINIKNSIRDARTPQPGEIFFNTMIYTSSITVQSSRYFQSGVSYIKVQIMLKYRK